MTLFEDLTITVFGITFVSYQIIMAVTSCYVGLFGVIAYFINKKDIAMQKLEEMKPINS